MSRSDRRGTFANTAIWTGALIAIAALTVWKFEIWPVSWVATETGTLADGDALSESFPAEPIEIAGPGSEAKPMIEPATATGELGPPPAELAALNIARELPSAADRKLPQWPAEPGPLPSAEDSRPLQSPNPAALPTGADFAETGLFPEAPIPTTAPPQQAEPVSLDAPGGSPVPGAVGDADALAPPGRVVPMAAIGSEVPANDAVVPAVGAGDSSTSNPASVPTPDPRLVAIDADIAANRYLAAHKSLSRLYWDEPELRPALQTRIDTTAKSIYFDAQPHYMAAYEVQPADQLRIIGEQYSVPWEYLARLNRIADPGRMRAGQSLKVIKGPFSAFVDLSDFTLTVHAHGYYVRRYPIGIGQDGTTPVGEFQVVLKEANPKYWGPEGNVLERDDPGNPLGERWIGLDDGEGRPTSYGIHGTIDPGSIGKAESRGCIRLRNEDVAEIYDLLGVGSQVVIQR